MDAEKPSPGHPSVLLVEDSDTLGQILVRILEHSGCDVRWATTGAAAVALMRRAAADVVLLDIQLPDADGLGLADQFRRDPKTASARLIGISATALPADQRRKLDAFLLKPVPFPVLLDAVTGQGSADTEGGTP